MLLFDHDAVFGVFMASRKKKSGETPKNQGQVNPDGTASIQRTVSAMLQEPIKV